MNSQRLDTAKPLTTLTRQLKHQVDVVSAYKALRHSNSMVSGLLETASISTKEHTRSLVLLSAALRIRCLGDEIVFEALNHNGRQLLTRVSGLFVHAQQSQSQVIVELSHERLRNTINEQEKLLAPSVFDALRKVLSDLKTNTFDDKSTQLIGTFSFDCYQLFEELPSLEDVEQDFPDYDFYLADRLLMIDHENLSSRLISKIFHGEKAEEIYFDYQDQMLKDEKTLEHVKVESLSSVTVKNSLKIHDVPVNLSNQQYSELVDIAKQHIINGDIFQMVLARDFSLACSDALLSYQHLKQSNPSPYMFFLSTPEYELFGASPESAVKYKKDNRKLSIYPIAGTRKRGIRDDGTMDSDLDSRIELELKSDEKEKAEHLMLVDLARNDVARVCRSGSRQIERLLEIDRYSHVMHLVSKVSGTLDDSFDSLHAYQACMNMGTLSGAPKVKATQLLREMEHQYRGVYGGAMGYINAYGDMDTAIVIRSALVKDGVAKVSAGAGIVYDSVAELEIKETENKAAAVMHAIHRANSALELKECN